jgi:hypothetical protein
MYEKQIQALKQRLVRVEVIRTYAGLMDRRDDWIKGNKQTGFRLSFLIVVGPPGSSKTHQFEHVKNSFYMNNAASGVGIYAAAYNNKDKDLIFDDVDDLLGQAAVVSLLKALGTDRETKWVSWTKQNTLLSSLGIPTGFYTKSRLCVLLNDFPRITTNMTAIFDRARVVVFIPPVPEVHRYVGKWFPKKDKLANEVYQFIGNNLAKIPVPSCRWYTEARNEGLLGRDWRKWLLSVWYDEDPLLSVALEIIDAIPPGKAREAEWAKRTGKARSYWYEYQQEAKNVRGAG